MKYSLCLAAKTTALAAIGLVLLGGKVLAESACCPAGHRTGSIPSLQKDLDARAANFAQTAPEPMKATFNNGIEHVAASGVVETAKRTGDQAPDFTLPSANGQDITLSHLLKDGPVVVVWYRGGWCPYCNIQLRHMQGILPQLKQSGAQLVAISPETPDNSLSTEDKNKLEFVVLSDADNHVARDFGIVYSLDDDTHSILEDRLKLSEFNGSDSKELPLTVAYVIKPDGTIAWDFVDPDYRARAEPHEILEAVQALSIDETTPAS